MALGLVPKDLGLVPRALGLVPNALFGLALPFFGFNVPLKVGSLYVTVTGKLFIGQTNLLHHPSQNLPLLPTNL